MDTPEVIQFRIDERVKYAANGAKNVCVHHMIYKCAPFELISARIKGLMDEILLFLWLFYFKEGAASNKIGMFREDCEKARSEGSRLTFKVLSNLTTSSIQN